MDALTLAHTTWNCKYHIVFDPKFRRQVIYGNAFKIRSSIVPLVTIRAMVQLSLAMNDLALKAKTASPKKPQDENPAYSFRTWLVRLGFIGEEFAESRKFLMKNFSGNSAWR